MSPIYITSAEEIFYGVDYSLEELTGATWEVVPAAADLNFIAIAQILGANTEEDSEFLFNSESFSILY